MAVRNLTPFFLLALSTLPAALSGAEISGRVTLASGAPGADLAQGTVVYFQADADSKAPLPSEAVEINMARKEFVPRVTAVPVGSTIGFPNQDPILHNVFSVSPGNEFDLGLYRRGEGQPTTFEGAGVVRVFCNVHHSMVAYVLVLDTPYYTRASPDGSFLLDGLPAGPGELTIWNDRSSPYSVSVVAGTTAPLELELTGDREVVPRHSNKHGKPYSRSRRSRVY